MNRLPVLRCLRIAVAGSLLGVLSLLSGCGSQHTTEAAGADGSYTASSGASVVPATSAESATPIARVETPAATNESTSTQTQPTLATAQPKVDTPTAEKLPVSDEVSKVTPSKTELTGDDTHRKHIIGTWLQQNEEKRTITVKDDGTATIVAELNDYRQYIVGKTLEFDVNWTLEGGKLTFITSGGRPAESIKYITALYGKSRVYRIIEFVEDRLTLKKDETGEDEPQWTRLPD